LRPGAQEFVVRSVRRLRRPQVLPSPRGQLPFRRLSRRHRFLRGDNGHRHGDKLPLRRQRGAAAPIRQVVSWEARSGWFIIGPAVIGQPRSAAEIGSSLHRLRQRLPVGTGRVVSAIRRGTPWGSDFDACFGADRSTSPCRSPGLAGASGFRAFATGSPETVAVTSQLDSQVRVSTGSSTCHAFESRRRRCHRPDLRKCRRRCRQHRRRLSSPHRQVLSHRRRSLSAPGGCSGRSQ